MQQSTNTENTNLYNQLVSTYSLTAELIENKLKEQKILVEQLLKLDKKIQKSGYNGIRDYILSIESLNISEEEKQLKILSFGRKFFGGLKETERILLLDLYLHKNGRLNSKNFSDKKASSLLKFHLLYNKHNKYYYAI
ncbi:MAG: hypothetical protein KatS3mg002_0827 [Candidatus Woesearchaeota archaeon]|nr:MAG: hypothetical protein KatS3mg002_0827 [Candidatus Woesearchaeota archaeon]